MEGEVERTGRTEIDRSVVRNRHVERTVERDAHETIDSQDGVDRPGASGVEADGLTDLRSRREGIDRDFLRVALRVATNVVDGTRGEAGDDSSVRNRRGDATIGRDAGGVTESGGRGGDTQRRGIACDRDVATDRHRTGEATHGEDLGARLVARTVVDGPGERGVATQHDGHVLVHVEVPAELTAETRFTERLTLITGHLSLGEDVQVQEGRLRDRVEDQVTATHRCPILIQNLAKAEQSALRVVGSEATEEPGAVLEELDILAQHHLIDEAGDADDLGTKELVHQRTEGLGLLTVANQNGDMDVLVQRHLNVGGAHVLNDDIVRVRLPLRLEFAGLGDVHNVTVPLKDILEITVDEVARHHVLDQDRERFVGPHFRDENVDIVLIDRGETKTENANERLHGGFPKETKLLFINSTLFRR